MWSRSRDSLFHLYQKYFGAISMKCRGLGRLMLIGELILIIYTVCCGFELKSSFQFSEPEGDLRNEANNIFSPRRGFLFDLRIRLCGSGANGDWITRWAR
jgi:hypothetical protein